MLLHLRMTALHKLACYTMNDNGADDCRVCFVVQNVAAGDNTGRLDVAIVCNSTVFTPDHEHRSMQRLYHHNHGYAQARVVEVVTNEDQNDKLDN